MLSSFLPLVRDKVKEKGKETEMRQSVSKTVVMYDSGWLHLQSWISRKTHEHYWSQQNRIEKEDKKPQVQTGKHTVHSKTRKRDFDIFIWHLHLKKRPPYPEHPSLLTVSQLQQKLFCLSQKLENVFSKLGSFWSLLPLFSLPPALHWS